MPSLPRQQTKISLALGRVALAFSCIIAGALLLWCLGALYFLALPLPVRLVLLAVYIGAVAWLVRPLTVRHFSRSLLASSVVLAAWLAVVHPRNDRAWTLDQAVLPYAEFDGDVVTIRKVRDFHYRSTTDYDARYLDRSVRLSDVRTVWFVVEPFSTWSAAAHTFVSFGFADGTYLAISVEIRKEIGESFSPLAGLFRRYELMYVIADERDLIRLRTGHRKDDVYLYLTTATPEQGQALFADMLARANRLRERPEFYNTAVSTCTTNIVAHINRIWPDRLPWSPWILLPGNSDRLGVETGLIRIDGDLSTERGRFRVNDRARAATDEDFSLLIRTGNER
jgi:hypothetical protein